MFVVVKTRAGSHQIAFVKMKRYDIEEVYVKGDISEGQGHRATWDAFRDKVDELFKERMDALESGSTQSPTTQGDPTQESMTQDIPTQIDELPASQSPTQPPAPEFPASQLSVSQYPDTQPQGSQFSQFSDLDLDNIQT
jgi:hypothetical protein